MKTTKKASYKYFLKNKRGDFYPTFIAGDYYVNIEAKEIDYISFGFCHIFFYMVDGTRFKVNLK